MMDFETARFNMIEQQIRPWEVLDHDVLDTLSAVRREEFVPPAFRSLAFTDTEIPLHLESGRTDEVMLAPKMEARFLQALAPRKHEYALEIGAGSGYMAALLAHRTREVLSLEIHPALAEFARRNIERSAVSGARISCADGSKWADDSEHRDTQWDLIALSGSLPSVGSEWLSRLKIGGRLVAIVGDEPAMKAQLVTRLDEQSYETKTLFETVVRRLRGFPARNRFTF